VLVEGTGLIVVLQRGSELRDAVCELVADDVFWPPSRNPAPQSQKSCSPEQKLCSLEQKSCSPEQKRCSVE